MSITSFAASIQVESGTNAHPKNNFLIPGTSRQNDGSDIEMYPISNASSHPRSGAPDSVREIQEDGNLSGQATEQIQTIWEPYGNRFRVLAACLTSLANGMNDAAPGALIASIEK